MSGGSSWRGNFWFTIDRGGRVHGYAVVAYEPVVDVAGLTNAIGYVRTVGSTALGLLGVKETIGSYWAANRVG